MRTLHYSGCPKGVWFIKLSFSFQLLSLPGGNSARRDIVFTLHPEVTSPEQPTVAHMCMRTVDTLTGLVEISLNFSYEYNPLIEEAIVNYTATPQNVDDNNKPSRTLAEFIYDSETSLIEAVKKYCCLDFMGILKTCFHFFQSLYSNGDCSVNPSSNLQITTEVI